MSNRKKTNKLKEKETDWQERIVQVRRVTKVVKGGKKLSFRAILIIGNEKGQVGVGVGKASDVIGAVKKAVTDGKKHLINVPITKDNSIPHIKMDKRVLFDREQIDWWMSNGCQFQSEFPTLKTA